MNNNTIQCLNFPEIKYAQQIANLCKSLSTNTINDVSFCYLENDTTSNRVLLRKLINSSNTKHCIVVSKNKELSFLAWKANALAFLYVNESETLNYTALKDRLKKYPPNNVVVEEKLRINFKGMDRVRHK
jgi:hypothetical protein